MRKSIMLAKSEQLHLNGYIQSIPSDDDASAHPYENTQTQQIIITPGRYEGPFQFHYFYFTLRLENLIYTGHLMSFCIECDVYLNAQLLATALLGRWCIVPPARPPVCIFPKRG